MREQTCCITGQHLRPGEDREQLTQRLRNIIGHHADRYASAQGRQQGVEA